MNRRRHRAVLGLTLAGAILMAGCGTAPQVVRSSPPRLARPVTLNTSQTSAAGTWAVVLMGGSAAQHNNFWQLFILQAGSAGWKLVTPPGTADNGGLVIAPSGQTLITAFRPNQGLDFSPLIQTTDGGKAWASLNPLDGPLADVPDALAVRPGGGLLALLTTGSVVAAAPGGTTWRTLASERAIAATAAGRRCGLTALTAVAVGPSGAPLLGGACARQGTAGIFAAAAGTWQLAGPAVPALAGADISVVRLIQVGGREIALLATGRTPGASLVAAWSDGRGHWTLSPPFAVGRAGIASASFGPGGVVAVQLGDRHGEVILPGRGWQPLPKLPPGTTALAAVPGGVVDALAVRRTRLTIWQARPGASAWARTQSVGVPIEFGSSS